MKNKLSMYEPLLERGKEILLEAKNPSIGFSRNEVEEISKQLLYRLYETEDPSSCAVEFLEVATGLRELYSHTSQDGPIYETTEVEDVLTRYTFKDGILHVSVVMKEE